MIADSNMAFSMALLSDLGDRKDQQDSAGYELRSNEGIVVLCDGMGGHEGGKVASDTATEGFLDLYKENYPIDDPVEMLTYAAKEIDRRIAGFTHKDGTKIMSGTTVVSVLVQRDCLYWLSVGDSRIYFFREGVMTRLGVDHNYGLLLQDRLNRGVISPEQYEEESENEAQLVSFLGRGNLPLIDYGKTAVKLKSGDRLLLMTDGLYKLLADDEINGVICNFVNPIEALQALLNKASRFANRKKIKRDNITMALIKVK